MVTGRPPQSQARINQDPVRLRRRRIARGLQQQALAKKAGVSIPHLSLVESGKRGASVDLLSRLASALDCEISDLMPPEQTPNSDSLVSPSNGHMPGRRAS